MNVQMRVDVLRTFITHLLVHIHQKEKIVLEIAAKIASVNGPKNFNKFIVEKNNSNLRAYKLIVKCPSMIFEIKLETNEWKFHLET